MGRDSWNVLVKDGFVHKGIKMMDDAVAEVPDSIVVRMVRANNSLQLPEFFKRKDIAKKDFQYLKMLITKSSVEIDSDIKAKVFYQLGTFSRQEGNVPEK